MNKKFLFGIYFFYIAVFPLLACTKKTTDVHPIPIVDSSMVNTAHLDHLYTDVSFPDGTQAAGIYIYSNYPDYVNVGATGEGFSCVDDVSRAMLVYLRTIGFSSDTARQSKLFNLIEFMLEMQSANGYFYNFLLSTSGQINTTGATSTNTPTWWSWRAFQALTEAAPTVKTLNPALFSKMTAAINKLVAQMKIDLVGLPQTTAVFSGIIVPQWLPDGSGSDQSSVLILGLINYCNANPDPIMSNFLKGLADGIVMMEQTDTMKFPYGAFLSWENTWHAYGNLQAYALMQAGSFLNDPKYTTAAMTEVDNFYPWLLQNGYQCSFSLSDTGGVLLVLGDTSYAQIAYGIEPMVFAAAEAYKESGEEKYADMTGHLAAWFLGANVANTNMYAVSTGICYDGISSASNVNLNSGGESTIEALLTLEKVETDPAFKTALDKYKKP